MAWLVVGMSLRTSVGTEVLTIENHSSGLLNDAGTRRTGTLFHVFQS